VCRGIHGHLARVELDERRDAGEEALAEPDLTRAHGHAEVLDLCAAVGRERELPASTAPHKEAARLAARQLLLFAFSICACNNSNEKNTVSNDSTTTDKKETGVASEKPVSLFDGKSLDGWHGFNKTGEIKNWKIEDGAMVCLGAAKDAHGGDIVTDNDYENFELSWEWKVTKGANSGVMYHVIESQEYVAPYETGPEYQIIDDIGFPDKLEEWQKTGADYAMYLPNDKKKKTRLANGIQAK
jgi:hypothetical protein